MAEKTYPMTLAEKEKLEKELEELKLLVRMGTYLKIVNMRQRKMNKPLLKVRFLA